MRTPRNPGKVSKPRVLVVDDDAGIRSLFCQVLLDAGYEPAEARDGAEALVVLRQGPWELVLTDHRMPKMTGCTMVRTMRAKGDWTPVVFLTGYAADIPQDEIRALKLTAVIQKPCSMDQVLGAVRAALHGRAP